jgi:hypothetical protein
MKEIRDIRKASMSAAYLRGKHKISFGKYEYPTGIVVGSGLMD